MGPGHAGADPVVSDPRLQDVDDNDDDDADADNDEKNCDSGSLLFFFFFFDVDEVLRGWWELPREGQSWHSEATR